MPAWTRQLTLAWEDPNVHPLSFTNSALHKNLLSISQHKMREKTPTYISCNKNTLFFGKMIAPANTERVTSLQYVQVHTLKKTPITNEQQ